MAYEEKKYDLNRKKCNEKMTSVENKTDYPACLKNSVKFLVA
jgi:hypothetical protein